MLGWVRRAAFTASSWKRARKLGSAASSGCSTLTTTSRPRTRSCPRQTLVMPPDATCSLSSYRSASRRGRPEPTCDMLISKCGALDPGDRDPRSLTRRTPSDRPRRLTGRADGADVVAAADGGDADPGPGIGGLDHGATADVHADVMDGGGVAHVVGEEHQVARGQAAQADMGAGVPLLPADPGQPHPGVAVGGHDQARAVVGAGAGRTPDVRLVQLAPGERGAGPGGAMPPGGVAPRPRPAGPA